MEATIVIQNLKCGGCETTILKKLKAINGVTAVSINVDTSTVHVDYTNSTVMDRVKDVLHSLGYPVIEAENSLGSKAKSYVSCAMGKLNKKYDEIIKS